DAVTDDIIFKNLEELSGGALKMDESAVLTSSQELSRATNTSSNNNKPRHKFQNNKHKHKHNHKHNNNNRKH
ncbi:MAG: hypothetical protein ACXVPQ_11385, partial [Bacteroidia bacterium]